VLHHHEHPLDGRHVVEQIGDDKRFQSPDSRLPINRRCTVITRLARAWIFLVIGLAGGGILSATAPIALLPVSLSLKLEARSPKVGQSVPLRIALRDAEGAEVAAAADLTVTISIEQTETPLTAVVLKGQASVTMSITFPRAGPIRVTASAPALRGSSIVAAVLADVHFHCLSTSFNFEDKL
jgi:hypothetical protein